MALSRKRDQYHRRAVAWNQFVIRTKSAVVTTAAVLWEWLNAFSDASTRRAAVEGYRRAHADAGITVAPFQRELIDSAVELYQARPDKSWSLTDCLLLVVMERHKLIEARTTDRHFEQAGLKPMMLDEPPAEL